MGLDVKLMPDRWQAVLDLVNRDGAATIDEIGRQLGVSPATVRRDLNRIQARGLITRRRGGASAVEQVREGAALAESRRLHPERKERIGRTAAALVRPGETIFLDGGYTTYQVARHLEASDVNVITNSADVVRILATRNGIRLIVIGGEFNRRSGSSVGPGTVRQIESFCADRAILGVDCLSPDNGLTAAGAEFGEVKRAMLERSRELVIVADHSKLNRFSLYRWGAVEDIDLLVTDAEGDPAALDDLRASGVQVTLAE